MEPVIENSKGYSVKAVIAVAVLVALVAFAGGVSVAQSGRSLFGAVAMRDENGALPDDLSYESIENLYDVLRRNYDGELTEGQLLDGLKEGLAHATGDPYTVYLNGEKAQQFEDDLNGTFTGIGAELGLEDELLTVIAPLDGFPAQKAGLRPQDTILAIDGEDTFNITIEEAVSKIRGEEGTDVTLSILRGEGERLDITITRAEIKLPSVEYEVLEGNVGYVQVSRFGDDTVELAKEAANSLKGQGVRGVVLDLRNNSGGFLQGAVDVAGIWLNNKVVVEQRRGEKVIDSLTTGRSPLLEGVPTVVLINEGSASASEIVAGALQDHKAATLVGKTSYGKGSVQSLEHIRDDDGILKVTIARWFTPNGNNIDKEGIRPDIEAEFTEEDYENDTDTQRDRALEVLLEENN